MPNYLYKVVLERPAAHDPNSLTRHTAYVRACSPPRAGQVAKVKLGGEPWTVVEIERVN